MSAQLHTCSLTATRCLQAAGYEAAARLGELPEPFNWTTNQPDPQPDIIIATVLGQRYAVRVVQLYLLEAWHKAMAWLCKVANIDQGLPCPAD